MEYDILVTANTTIEDSTSFVSTAQLDSGVEHLLSSTLVAGVLCNCFSLSVFSGKGLDSGTLSS